MNIKPIRNNDDLNDAVARIEALLGAAPGSPEDDELEVLTVLVKAYEDEHFPIPPVGGVAAIRFRMEAAGLSEADLEAFIGSRQQVNDVLSGVLPLTVQMIKNLHKGLKIPYKLLID